MLIDGWCKAHELYRRTLRPALLPCDLEEGQGGRSKFERMCDFYAGWAYNSKAHPDGKTKPGSGEGHDVDVFEIANAFKQKLPIVSH